MDFDREMKLRANRKIICFPDRCKEDHWLSRARTRVVCRVKSAGHWLGSWGNHNPCFGQLVRCTTFRIAAETEKPAHKRISAFSSVLCRVVHKAKDDSDQLKKCLNSRYPYSQSFWDCSSSPSVSDVTTKVEVWHHILINKILFYIKYGQWEAPPVFLKVIKH